MKDFFVNIGIIALLLGAYYFDVFSMFTSGHIWIFIGIVIFLLFAAALKILGNPFAKDKSDD